MNSTVSDIVTSTSGMPINFIILCHLYPLLKQWVSKESIGPNITNTKPDTDINSDNNMAFIFSTADCTVYKKLRRNGYSQCATEVDLYKYDRNMNVMRWLANCFLFFFMTKKDAGEKCYHEFDNDINDMTLSSKDRILFSFMTDFLGGLDVCETNTTVSHEADVKKRILTPKICYPYSRLQSRNAENICWPTSEKDTLSNATTGGISHYECVWHRLETELGAKMFCKQARQCNMYSFVMQGIIGGFISVIGIVCNIGSLVVFHHSVIKTPTTYQMRWLARVDTVFLVLCFIYENFFYMIKYFHINIGKDNVYWRVIWPHIQVYIQPVFIIAQTSTNWLTVFIGVYRYLSICKPLSNAYRHVEQHRRKYVMMVLIMAALCNIPYFFVFHLSRNDKNNKVYFRYDRTDFGKSEYQLVYHNIMHLAFTVCFPIIILSHCNRKNGGSSENRKEKHAELKHIEPQY